MIPSSATTSSSTTSSASKVIILKSLHPSSGGDFGAVVALNGSLAVVGAPYENSQAGNAYLYNTSAKTHFALSHTGGMFGAAVSINSQFVVVGAPEKDASEGDAYVFNATTGKFLRSLTDPSPQGDGLFGYSVALSPSNDLVAVGAPAQTDSLGFYPEDGQVYIFNVATGALLNTLTSPNATDGGEFGRALSMSGDNVMVGAPFESSTTVHDSGNAYVVNAVAGTLVSYMTSPNPIGGGEFGITVALYGNTAVVGAPLETAHGETNSGNAYIFNAANGALEFTLSSAHPIEDGSFGTSVSASGNLVTVSAPFETDHAYAFYASNGSLAKTLVVPKASGRAVPVAAVSGDLAILGMPSYTGKGITDGAAFVMTA
jgi:WD40 repeat protein